MAIQQWLFSFRGRIGCHDFWVWIGLWFVGMPVLFSLMSENSLDIQAAAFCLVCLLWPVAAVTVERLHDRGRSGVRVLLMIMVWMLLTGNWVVLPGVWQRVAGCFVSTLILVMMLIDLGTFVGTQGENKCGKDAQDMRYRVDNKSSN